MESTSTSPDPFAQFKAVQREGWKLFAPFEVHTIVAAAKLVRFAEVRSGERVLDVACGTGVVAITAARSGAQVTGLDLTPELLAAAKESARIAEMSIEFRVGDVETLPFGDGTFDVVLSQFGHIFAPRPPLATREMLRVLRSGGRIAFSTWPPELFMGLMFKLVSSYMPPPSSGAAPPQQWGDPNIVRERLANAVSDLTFDRDLVFTPGLSSSHLVADFERISGPVVKLVQTLKEDPPRLAEFRAAFKKLIETYHKENLLHQSFLMTRATKRS